jgi:hypothetical protein
VEDSGGEARSASFRRPCGLDLLKSPILAFQPSNQHDNEYNETQNRYEPPDAAIEQVVAGSDRHRPRNGADYIYPILVPAFHPTSAQIAILRNIEQCRTHYPQ